MAMIEAAALAVKAVSHSYGGPPVLKDVSFTLKPGSFTVLLGLNGAGKTTLFSLITRLFNVRHGAITMFGHDLRDEPGAALRKLGIVFQARTLDLDLTVAQNLAYHASLHGLNGPQARARARELLTAMELADKFDEKARSLSGGQMRRVEIARALLHRPQLLLLDEATVGLDIQSRTAIVKEIRRLVQDERIAVLWATHLIDEVEQGDDVLVLAKGTLVAAGRVDDVIKSTETQSMADAFVKLVGRPAKAEAA